MSVVRQEWSVYDVPHDPASRVHLLYWFVKAEEKSDTMSVRWGYTLSRARPEFNDAEHAGGLLGPMVHVYV
jgi:hypothetical protein